MDEIKRRPAGKSKLIPLGDGWYRVTARRWPISQRWMREPTSAAEREAAQAAHDAADRLRNTTDDTRRFQQLIAEVSEVYRPSGVLIWLNSPNKHLGGKSPRELIDNGTDDDWAQLLNESGRLASW